MNTRSILQWMPYIGNKAAALNKIIRSMGN